MPKRTAVDRRPGALRRKVKSTASVPESAHPPTWIKPQLTRLVDEAPTDKGWLHEVKYDGYRMHAAPSATRSDAYSAFQSPNSNPRSTTSATLWSRRAR